MSDTIASVNPATGQEIARFSLHKAPQVDAMLSAAVDAQRGWRNIPVRERLLLLSRMAT